MKSTRAVASLTVVVLLVAGAWASTETVLYGFTGGSERANPYAGLIVDAAGNLYGTTGNGGAFNDGVLFEITP